MQTPKRTSILFLLPIYNEEVQLADSVRKLFEAATIQLSPEKYDFVVAIGDNASIDSSPAIAMQLEEEFARKVRHIRIEQKGRGRMLKRVWLEESFDYSLYMDVDLSTDLAAITPMIEALEKGAELGVAVRLGDGAKVVGRSLLREISSRVNCFCIRVLGGSKIRDFQCGFKAISKPAALRYLPFISDTNWFFDTELILFVEHTGGDIHQQPVHWVDDPGTTVNVWKTAKQSLGGLIRVRREQPWKQFKG